MDMVFLYTSNDHSIVNYFLTLEGFPEKSKNPHCCLKKTMQCGYQALFYNVNCVCALLIKIKLCFGYVQVFNDDDESLLPR